VKRDGKDGKSLKHDLDDYVHHNRCPRIYFQSMEETFDAIKDVRYKLIDIFNRIERFLGTKNRLRKEAT
jgi:hypothetical protein